jgi:hypothetical protein
MKSILIITLSLALVINFGCTKSESPGGLEEFQGGHEQKDLQLINSSDEYLDSIQKLGLRIEKLISSQESIKERIVFLTIRKDSIETSLIQIESSLNQVKNNKIEPGIKSVNEKMDELKGLKEVLLEQQELQKMEILLAEKKRNLLEEEKGVYTNQHQLLWDKGAPPSDFKMVDSLLVGINLQIDEQSNRLKILNRKVADIEDQVKIIDQQRNSLSNKIRNNYTAQEIFEEFATEEKERLEKQLITINEQLNLVTAKQKELNTQMAMHKGEKTYLQLKQDAVDAQKLTEKAKLKQEILAEHELDILKSKRSKRITNALFGIGIVALILFFLYYMGKKRKSRMVKKVVK